MVTVALYTLAGALSSVAVGGSLGFLGSSMLPSGAAIADAVVVLTVALLAAVRELGWVRVPIPQPRRQTKDVWAKNLGLRRAAVLWGLDLGATITTRFTFAGTWVIVLVAALSADPLIAATALLANWLGRAAPVWVVPSLVTGQSSVLDLLDAIALQDRAFRRMHVAGLVLIVVYVWSAVVTV